MKCSDRSVEGCEVVQMIRRWIAGTPMENLVRALLRGFNTSRRAAGSISPAGVDLNTLYDVQTTAVMERVLGRRSNCIDVGCHQGTILDIMLRFAPEGRHFAFEPLPHMHTALVTKYATVPNIELHELALSDTSGETTFQHVVTNPGYSGLLRRHYDRPNEQIEEIKVRKGRLDDIVPAGIPIRLLKVDVEGAELQVFRGAIGILRRSRPFIVFEHGKGAADYYDTRPEQIFDLLADSGLCLSLMGDWLESDGASALSRAAFVDQFDEGRNYYFLAHP